MTKPANFRQSDVTRAIKAALRAGIKHPIATVHTLSGRITVAPGAPPKTGDDQKNEWDEVCATSATGTTNK
jgi:hypothetical protein